jgi:hypothetical protein
MRVFAALSIMALASANPAKPMERLVQTTTGNNGGVLGNLISDGSQRKYHCNLLVASPALYVCL